MPGRKGFQEHLINKDPIRGVKKPKLVLDLVQVHGSLPSYSRIYHPHKAGRNIQIPDTAFIPTGHKSADIGNHTSTEVDQEAVAPRILMYEFHP